LTALQLVETPIEDEVTFENARLLHPKKCAKKDALKAWTRLSYAERRAALIALAKWRRYWIAKDMIDFVPYLATWLRGERWDDEFPADALPAHASHVPMARKEAPERSEMPAEFRAQIAKLK